MPAAAHIICLAPSLLGPVPETLAQAVGTISRPNLEALLRLASPMPCQASGSEGLLAERFPNLPAPGPLVAGALHAKPAGYCYRAAPIHLRADRDRLLVFAGNDCVLDEAESRAICEAVNAAFKDEGITLVAHASEWLLFVDTPPGPTLPALSKVAGRYLDAVLPMDSATKRWRQLLNELQMLLHMHPVNQAREAAGLLVANGLWAWGGGPIEPSDSSNGLPEGWAFQGDSALAQGANAFQKTQPKDYTRGCVWIDETAERSLMGGDAGAWLAAIDAFEQTLAKRLRADLENGTKTIEFRVGNGSGWRIDQRSRWRFWRRQRPLRQFIKVQE